MSIRGMNAICLIRAFPVKNRQKEWWRLPKQSLPQSIIQLTCERPILFVEIPGSPQWQWPTRQHRQYWISHWTMANFPSNPSLWDQVKNKYEEGLLWNLFWLSLCNPLNYGSYLAASVGVGWSEPPSLVTGKQECERLIIQSAQERRGSPNWREETRALLLSSRLNDVVIRPISCAVDSKRPHVRT